MAKLKIDDKTVHVALHVGPIGLSHRMRDEVERRFQNPGQNRPLKQVIGIPVLLVGLWDTDAHLKIKRPVLAVMEATDHRFSQATRQSYFVPLHALLSGAESGGVSETENLEENSRAVERAVRQAWRVVRDSQFAKRVKDAYRGRCAMCGLGHSLVEAAHILPVAASGSSDDLPNGLCLCPNHHTAFDRHLIYILPETLEIRIHPKVCALDQKASHLFVESTFSELAEPQSPIAKPARESFNLRYEHFGSQYDWAT